MGGVIKELPPTVASEDIAEARYMIYLIELRCQPYLVCWYLHVARIVEAFPVIAAFLKRMTRNGHGAQKFFHACVATRGLSTAFAL